MNHIGIYFACVFAVLLVVTFGLIFVARATKWKPKPIKAVWAVLVICLADFVAGSICSFFGRDIHILYWFLIGVPVAAIFIPLIVVITNLFVRLFMRVLFMMLHKR
jgi:hypothetical protein